jgi:hypothetical protein
MEKILNILIKKFDLPNKPDPEKLLEWSKKMIELLDSGYSTEEAINYAANYAFNLPSPPRSGNKYKRVE